jgi:hypothetical protein
MSPALRPVCEVIDKLNPKPEPRLLPAQGKRVEPGWRLARKRRALTGTAQLSGGHRPRVESTSFP